MNPLLINQNDLSNEKKEDLLELIDYWKGKYYSTAKIFGLTSACFAAVLILYLFEWSGLKWSDSAQIGNFICERFLLSSIISYNLFYYYSENDEEPFFNTEKLKKTLFKKWLNFITLFIIVFVAITLFLRLAKYMILGA